VSEYVVNGEATAGGRRVLRGQPEALRLRGGLSPFLLRSPGIAAPAVGLEVDLRKLSTRSAKNLPIYTPALTR
jgi:hypothetical protein